MYGLMYAPVALTGALLFESVSGHEAHSSTTAIPGPEVFVRRALEQFPGLSAADLRSAAADAESEAASALEDPQLSVAANNVPFDPLSLDATPMTGIRLGIDQRLPWPGKRALAQEILKERAEGLRAARDEAALDLARRVRESYYQLHFIDVARQVIRRNLSNVDQIVDAAQAQYRVGRTELQDVLTAKTGRAELTAKALELERQRTARVAELNALTGAPPERPIPALMAVPVTDLNEVPPLEALISLASKHRPVLRSLSAFAREEKTRSDLARRGRYPDLRVGLAYTFRGDGGGVDPVDGADFFSVNLGITLPVFYAARQEPSARAANLRREAHLKEADAVRVEIHERIGTARAQIPRLEREMQIYVDEIIPVTRQSLEADRAAYEVGKGDLVRLLDVEMRLLNLEVTYHRLHVERERWIVRLAHTVGVEPADLLKLRGTKR